MASRVIAQPADKRQLICTSCRTRKPHAEFYRAKPGSANDKTYGGFAMPCKECNRARCRGKARSEAQRARDAERKRRPEILEQSRQRAAEWYASDHGKAWMREYGARRYAENGGEICAINRARYHADPAIRERIALAARQKRATPDGRAAHNARNSIYKKGDRGRLLSRMHAQIRRARVRSAVCDLTDAQWLALVAAYGGCCAYCECSAAMTIDHIEPVAKGGAHTLKNVVPACKRCNQVKGALSLPEALAKLNVTRVDFLKRQGLALLQMIRGT